jgi:hypothetical protein
MITHDIICIVALLSDISTVAHQSHVVLLPVALLAVSQFIRFIVIVNYIITSTRH